MDTCKIATSLYQYTAIDDSTRYRVLRLNKLRTAANTINFIGTVIEEMPFLRYSDFGQIGEQSFFRKSKKALDAIKIKFRPNTPASPHLNGKVEHSQKTDKAKFYATIGLKNADVNNLLAEWQYYYNWERPHSTHNGKTPTERCLELSEQLPVYRWGRGALSSSQ